MLPLSSADDAAGPSRGARPLIEYASRMYNYKHMDFEYALWLMANLCTSPRTAFRTTLYHSRTKHQWARDDPAFIVVLLYLLLIAATAWSLAFGRGSPLSVIGLFLYVATVDFLVLGAALSTAGWWLSNTYLHDRGSEAVEWLYAFDVHCNAFLPLYLLLHVVQYVMLPLLLRPGILALLLSNALYGAAFSAYHYLTFLGYSELPFLHHCEVFVYPIALVVVALVLSLLVNLNCTATVAYIYFG